MVRADVLSDIDFVGSEFDAVLLSQIIGLNCWHLIMLIQKEINPNMLSIKRYQPGLISVSGKEFAQVIAITSTSIREFSDPIMFNDISGDFLLDLIAKDTEILLIGSGEKHRFVPTAETAVILKAGISVECMSTRNACHTFQVLAHENRKVVALLFP